MLKTNYSFASVLFGGINMRKKWLSISLVTLLAVLLIGIKIYQTHPEYFPEFKSAASQDKVDETSEIDWKAQEEFEQEQKDLPPEEHRFEYMEGTFPFATVDQKKFAEKYPDKFSIVKKMFYSPDYIDNAEGEFVEGNAEDGLKRKVSFYVDFVNKKNREEVTQIEEGKVVETQRNLFENGIEILEMPAKHLFTKKTIKDDRISNSMTLNNHSVTDSGIGWNRIYNNYPDWDYTENTKFGMPVYQIEGMRENIKGKTPFTMTVAQKTGALLSLKEYDKDDKDKLTFYQTVKSIKINQGVSDDVFQLDVSNDKEVTFKEYLINTLAWKKSGKKMGGVDTSHD